MGTWYPNPDEENRIRAQLEHKSLKEERPPQRLPGDNYVLFGTLAGMLIGTIIGLNIGNPFLFVPAGFIAGGIAGTVIGTLLKNLVTRGRGAR
jgi:outer membrane lipoprotein SlyB